ncbi:hypothetical protein MKZ38_004764 [Zalerion maritima]|uniref:pectin lyase n=1 Tax=Zalerion maritima TaxID=339359 RepID=A0AAD5WWU5_9PEZI|nr:hypothetical protein MKZ38_004764 [Zalerion maritima]
MMKSSIIVAVAATFAQRALAVTGAAEGFATGVTGGGSAAEVYPSTINELVSYLGDDEARVIVLSQEFNFLDSEGTTTETGCAPWGTDSACQLAINQNGWCDNYQADADQVSVTYDNAGTLGITVASDKTLVGEGSAGVIRGKGLRIVSGASNIIIQNIHITELNPEYVWGGDAITLNDCDMVWVDHVKTSLIGRQHIVLGEDASNRVTISNCEFDGVTDWSATCDGQHYWGLYFTGSNDMITLQQNYIHHMSGRSPKVGGNTLLHAVNNYWYSSTGHAFEVGDGAMVVAEGNVFQNINTPVEDDIEGLLFTSPSSSANTACYDYLGHNCELNAFGSSGDFSSSDTSFFSYFEGKNVADATAATAAKSVMNDAGFGNI